MQPELHPAAEMEGDTWSTTRDKSTEAFLIEGNKCFSDEEMPFCPSSHPISHHLTGQAEIEKGPG